MRPHHGGWLALFFLGSLATILLALYLYRVGRPVAAGAVIVASPFPCPPGLPC